MRVYWKKCVLTLAVLVLAAGICGCEGASDIDRGLREYKKNSDDKYWAERNIPPVELDMEVTGIEANTDVRVCRCIYSFLEDGNKEMLKKTFAASVIDRCSELDEKLDVLMEYYNELDVKAFEIKTNSEYKSHRIDSGETVIEYIYHTQFEYNNERYELDILFVKESSLNRDLEGVHGIKLRNRDTNKVVVVNTVIWDI